MNDHSVSKFYLDLVFAPPKQIHEWVRQCLDARKNGASEEEVVRLTKVVSRLLPAAAEVLSAAAAASVSQQHAFEAELSALAHG